VKKAAFSERIVRWLQKPTAAFADLDAAMGAYADIDEDVEALMVAYARRHQRRIRPG